MGEAEAETAALEEAKLFRQKLLDQGSLGGAFFWSSFLLPSCMVWMLPSSPCLSWREFVSSKKLDRMLQLVALLQWLVSMFPWSLGIPEHRVGHLMGLKQVDGRISYHHVTWPRELLDYIDYEWHPTPIQTNVRSPEWACAGELLLSWFSLFMPWMAILMAFEWVYSKQKRDHVTSVSCDWSDVAMPIVEVQFHKRLARLHRRG